MFITASEMIPSVLPNTSAKLSFAKKIAPNYPFLKGTCFCHICKHSDNLYGANIAWTNEMSIENEIAERHGKALLY